MTAIRADRTAPGPTPVPERALAPDLARGGMLLLIAVANASGVFLASAPGLEPDPVGAERAYNLLLTLFVHARALPLFALLFGYGLVQLWHRQTATGTARTVLLRRNAWLVAFGTVHGILLYAGDILAAYGVIGILATLLLLPRGDRFFRIGARGYLGFVAVYLVGLAALALPGLRGPDPRTPPPLTPFGSAAADSYPAAVATRLTEWPLGTLVFLPLILIVFLGAAAGRLRILEGPAPHRRTLRLGAALGLTVAVLGGLPMGLVAGGFAGAAPEALTWVRLLYETSGLFGGIGYLCLFALLGLRLGRRPQPGPVAYAVAALGRRSLSGYLTQSVAWLLLASPYALALGTRTGSPLFTAGVCALAVWLLTVAGAAALERRGLPGPAERLLRRLTYRS